ncbi:hypothetical protein DL765_003657 [Monosporascus sp. GIB2]|nr:hypothetical protein DL765_003657 [Monosporascus sp. GIB2]
MAGSPATSGRPVSPDDSGGLVKYRMSCDRCLNIKVRCSQDKPECKRCARKSVSCVYSPLRRIGRPRKAGQIGPVNTSVDKSTPAPGTMASTPDSSLSDNHQGYSDGATTDFTSMGSVTSAMTTPQNGLGSWDSGIADTPMVDPNDGPIGNDTRTAHRSSSSGDRGIQRLGMNSWALDRHLSAAMHARPQEASLRTALQTFVNGPITQSAPDTVIDCYVAILTRTIRLEQSMVTAPRAPAIDLVLEAESDLRALKQRLFACVGHAPNGRDCLASDRPVFSVCLC